MTHSFFQGTDRAFSAKWLQARLVEHFGDQIVICNANGKSNVITFVETASTILHEFREQSVSIYGSRYQSTSTISIMPAP